MLKFNTPSPCINNCKLDSKTGLCIGCVRTIDEITRWSLMHNDERKAIMVKVKERRQAEEKNTKTIR